MKSIKLFAFAGLLCAAAALYAAIGADAVVTLATPTVAPAANYVKPASIMSDWVPVCDAPATFDGASNGAAVTNPSAITRAEQHWLQLLGQGTSVQVTLRYPTAATGTTSPIVQLFGRDANGVTQALYDPSGTHPLTLTIDAANDARETSTNFSYTKAIEVDAEACKEVIVAVKTALAGTGITNAVIMARIK